MEHSRPRRSHVRLALLAVCAAAGVLATLLVPTEGHESTGRAQETTTTAAPPAPVVTTGTAPTTGSWTPIKVTRPKVPIIAGGIPVDVDPSTSRTDFTETLLPLGARRYRMTVFNTSTLGAIDSFQWYPPVGVKIVKVMGTTRGRCRQTGLTGFGGNQFPTLVLYPNIFCEKVDLKPATCTCRGDGGSVTITFQTSKPIAVNEGELRLRTATVAFDRMPTYVGAPRARHVKRIVLARRSSGGLSARERDDAQAALDSLQDSNISFQLVTISQKWAQNVPATCRLRVVSRSPQTYRVYLFWVPWLAAEPYIWLTMNVTGDPSTSTFNLGATQPVLPGGRLQKNGRTVNRMSVDTTLLSRYGEEQAKKGRQLMRAHSGGTFAKPGSGCQVLKNGSLRLVAH